MRRILQGMAAFTAAALLAAQTMPVNAVYQSRDEIAFALRGIETENCGYIADGNTVYVSPGAAASGTSVRIGMYIEAEYADLAFLYAKLKSDDDSITFNEESYHNPTKTYSEEKITYTLEDGTEFSTRLKPYCLGMINSGGYYQANSFGVTNKFTPEENSMNLTWMYGYGDVNSTSATFFGSRSDEFSFIEVELTIAPDTKAGEYRVFFVTDDGTEMGATYLTSDDSENGESFYQHIVPTLKDLRIVIPDSEYFIMEHPTAYRWLDDTTPLASEDFFPEGTTIYRDTADGYVAELLDFEKFSTGVHGMTIQHLTDPEAFICGNMFEAYYDGMALSTPEFYDGNILFSTVISGLRGDANNDQVVNANDAAVILAYAAERGASGNAVLYSAEDESLEKKVYFLADVNEGSKNCGNDDGTSLDANDASAILSYASIVGSGVTADWNEILK